MSELFNELKRRNVVRVGIAYLVFGWLIIEVMDTVAPRIGMPDWVPTFFVIAVLIGLPITLLFSWAYEITPGGLKKTEEVDADSSISHSTGRKLDRVIIAALVLALGYFVWERQAGPPVSETPTETATLAPTSVAPAAASIAVLPFADLSPEGDQEYFADGLSEEILNALVGVDALTVASRTSSFQFKGQEIGLPDIAARLKVAYVLEGSVRKAGGTIRVTGQLIEAASDKHLWSQSFDRELTTENIFAIQDEIAKAIVGALSQELELDANPEAVQVKAGTANLSAYETFLEGREVYLARSSRDDVAASMVLFEAAVEKDPTFARAWAWLGAAYSAGIGWRVADERDFVSLTNDAVERALAIDPGLALAYAVRGLAVSERVPPDWELAIDQLAKAIELDPKNPTSYLWDGLTYQELGYLGQAQAKINRCLEIDPDYYNCQRHSARNYFYQGDNGAAMAAMGSMRELRIPANVTDLLLVWLFVREGQEIAARLLFEDLVPVNANFPLQDWFEALRDPNGDHSELRAQLEGWINSADLVPLHRALFNQSIGAYEKIQMPASRRTAGIHWLPGYSDFRKSESFKRLIRKTHIIDYWQAHGFPPQCRDLGNNDFECD